MNRKEILRLCWSLLWWWMVSYIKSTCGECAELQICSEELQKDEVIEKVNYVLGKYKQVGLKITGEPFYISGKRIYTNSKEQFFVQFLYKDNTERDIIQKCKFVVYKIGDCEFISTTCNSFLEHTPRPILMQKKLRTCDKDVEIYEELEAEKNKQAPAPIDDIDEATTETETVTGYDASSREQESLEVR